MIGDGYECDECGKKEVRPLVVDGCRFNNGWPGLPAGWYSVSGPDVGWDGDRAVTIPRHHFCSITCLTEWSYS